jgi:hypothetical protein
MKHAVDGYIDNFLDYCAAGGLITDGALAVPMVQDALTDLAETYDPEDDGRRRGCLQASSDSFRSSLSARIPRNSCPGQGERQPAAASRAN